MRTKQKTTVRTLTYAALGAALLSMSALLAIPLPIPITLQSLTLFFLLSLFGSTGLFSLLLYYAVGMLGLPVFSGFSGGLAVLLSPTGGYLLGFLPAALFFLLLRHLSAPEALAAAVATLLIYTAGTLHYCLLYTAYTSADLVSVICVCVLPYLLPDAVKLTLALLLSRRLKPILDKSAT